MFLLKCRVNLSIKIVLTRKIDHTYLRLQYFASVFVWGKLYVTQTHNVLFAVSLRFQPVVPFYFIPNGEQRSGTHIWRSTTHLRLCFISGRAFLGLSWYRRYRCLRIILNSSWYFIVRTRLNNFTFNLLFFMTFQLCIFSQQSLLFAILPNHSLFAFILPCVVNFVYF